LYSLKYLHPLPGSKCGKETGGNSLRSRVASASKSCFKSELGRAYSAPAINVQLFSSDPRPRKAPDQMRIKLPRIATVQLQDELEAPARESQNLGIGAPPAAPVAGIVMFCSVMDPFDITMPLGTISEGWSNGAL
jgi:hypothetical protein